VIHAHGADLVEGRQDPRALRPIDAAFLRPAPGSAEKGLRGEYFKGRALEGAPALSRGEPVVAFRWDRGSPTDDLVARGELPAERALGPDDFSVRFTGELVAPVSGQYTISVSADDGFRLDIEGRRVLDEWTPTPRARARSVTLTLEAAKAYPIRLEYFEALRDAELRLCWEPPGAKPPFEEAVEAARAADVTLFVGGLTGDVEGEEMRISYPGFAGGDRTEIALPKSQETLLRALHATGKPVVLVLTTGSAIALPWEQQNLPAVLVAWYPGQQGGNAVADVLFGAANPSGRLPVTFYASVDQLPPFADYAMKGRTYRYFEGQPLFPFGHGLSYTRFEYKDLRIDKPAVGPNEPFEVSLNVRNAGGRAGHEVVQLYERAVPAQDGAPLQSLRGFERVLLQPGEERRVRFRLTPAADLARYDVASRAFVARPGEHEIQVSASSRDIRLRGRVRVQ
jgi:beta-glucosidase